MVTIDALKSLLKPALGWVVLSLLLNLVWESAQLPLYTIWQTESAARIAYFTLHCTAGDGLISLTAFLLASLALGTPNWPYSKHWRGDAIATFFGVAYTVYSEWNNVYQVSAWTYSPAMPLVFGIGLSPLIQWLVIPSFSLFIMRARGKKLQRSSFRLGDRA